MATMNQRKHRTGLSKEILKSIRKALSKNYSIRKAAEEAEISNGCAQVINKIQQGRTDEEILDVPKERPKKVNIDMELKVKSILTKD